MQTIERQHAMILSGGETATTDYLLVPHLQGLGYEVTLLDSRAALPASVFEAGSLRMVVISRYVPAHWFAALERLRRQGGRLVYFMDDDLFDLAAMQGLPLRYRWKIFTQAWVHRSRLLRMCEQFWVSTPYLAGKYAQHKPTLISPLPTSKTLERQAGIHVCYHGTASHREEIEWLVPVIWAVQAQSDNIHFELFGGRELNNRVGKFPRVSVLHPMSWPNYLAYTSVEQRDIGLAPLLPGMFNAARGPTKFFDYARMGAVGLYSDVAPYRGFVRDGQDGLLLANDPSVWVDALLALARNEPGRAAMATSARQRALDMVNINR
jgi:hypothetical protein